MPTPRTSEDSPIRIAAVTPRDGHGRIGITLCPGKTDPNGISGPWARDLDTDLDAIQRWGATAVVTLLEDHEFDLLEVRDLPRKVRDRHMEWWHLPIQDGKSPPARGFEDKWEVAGHALRDRLRLGFDVLVHCRGGLGRAGTIAARLLVELGERADNAIRRVREVRPGALETEEQEDHVARCAPRAPSVALQTADPASAGNGSLMRLAPVALRFWNDRPRLAATAAEQSRTTHGAEEAVDACRGFAELLADAVAGSPRADVLARRPFEGAEAITRILAGSWRGRPRKEIRSSGYVVHTLEAAIWSVARTGNFRNAILLATNLADDADTVAAVAGQLAGALYGLRGIPEGWLEKLAWRDRLLESGRRALAEPLG